MKVRLTGIFEQNEVAAASSDKETPPAGPVIIARLDNLPDDPYSSFTVNYAALQGAQVGDEFTLHLERVNK
jgi:hypothetical protein